MSDLETQREIINKIDAQIIDLIAERQSAVQGVIAAKKQTGQAALQPARWEQVVTRVRQKAAEKGIDPDLVEAIWNELHEYFLKLEEKELSE